MVITETRVFTFPNSRSGSDNVEILQRDLVLGQFYHCDTMSSDSRIILTATKVYTVSGDKERVRAGIDIPEEATE